MVNRARHITHAVIDHLALCAFSTRALLAFTSAQSQYENSRSRGNGAADNPRAAYHRLYSLCTRGVMELLRGDTVRN